MHFTHIANWRQLPFGAAFGTSGISSSLLTAISRIASESDGSIRQKHRACAQTRHKTPSNLSSLAKLVTCKIAQVRHMRLAHVCLSIIQWVIVRLVSVKQVDLHF